MDRHWGIVLVLLVLVLWGPLVGFVIFRSLP
jgi:hypothetical protein